MAGGDAAEQRVADGDALLVAVELVERLALVDAQLYVGQFGRAAQRLQQVGYALLACHLRGTESKKSAAIHERSTRTKLYLHKKKCWIRHAQTLVAKEDAEVHLGEEGHGVVGDVTASHQPARRSGHDVHVLDGRQAQPVECVQLANAEV